VKAWGIFDQVRLDAIPEEVRLYVPREEERFHATHVQVHARSNAIRKDKY
jgi:hypothetical protein